MRRYKIINKINFFRFPGGTFTVRIGLFFLILLFCVLLAVSANAKDIGKDRASLWNKALKPLETMPVQETGMIRSFLTFSDYKLISLYGKRSYKNMSSIQAILRLMVDSEFYHNEPIIKIVHPFLTKTFGAKYISLAQYEESELSGDADNLSESARSEFQKPLMELADSVENLKSADYACGLFPRDDEWLSAAEYLHGMMNNTVAASDGDNEIIRAYMRLSKALRDDDLAKGESAASELARAVSKAALKTGANLKTMRLDAFYQRLEPFAKSAFLYLIAFFIFIAVMIFKVKRLELAGDFFMMLGFFEQILGIVLRWMITGRAPLSNMYESFVFLTAGIILIGYIFEKINKTGFTLPVCSAMGFVFMVIAHKAPIFDSKINPIMPALQSSWLTYHVVTIMLSYSAFALSFAVACLFLFKDFLGGDSSSLGLIRRLPAMNTIEELNYKIIAVGFPLLTIGIITGAVWANIAWGRPWGFDPKETWSAITWLIYVAYLHARLLGNFKGRKSVIISAIGFLAVLFTYLGVNFLLPSIHSYV